MEKVPKTLPDSMSSTIRRKRTPKKPKPKGQRKGPKRRDYTHLPATIEIQDLPQDQKACPDCGEPFDEFPGTEDGTTLGIDV
ncbi:MAG: hypothetical protein ACFCD0_18385 [Gemmataceae bacterium]